MKQFICTCIPKQFEAGVFLFINIPLEAEGFTVDNAMQYFIFKVPNQKAAKEYFENLLFEEMEKPDDLFKTGGCKLPEGEFKIVGKLYRMQQANVDMVGFSNLMGTIAEHKLVPKQTIVLQKLSLQA